MHVTAPIRVHQGGETAPTARKLRSRLRPSLRTVLLIVNLGIVVLPLGSIFFFRIYENQLLNQTEAELISQAAFIAALYRSEIRDHHPEPVAYGKRLPNRPPPDPEARFEPIEPQLDFTQAATRPRRPPGRPVPQGPDPFAVALGERLTPVLADAQRVTLAGMKILDFNGVTVSGRQEIGLSFAHVEEVATALGGDYTSVVRTRVSNSPSPALSSVSRGTGIRLFAALPVIENDRLWGVVYVSRTPKNILKHMYAEREKVILAGLTILVLSIAIVLLTSSRISRPIHQLIDRTRRASAGDLEAIAPLDRPGTREVGLLSQSFAEMARSLNARSNYIRDFATRVSHEFKTPLTAIRGAAELLSDSVDDMPAEKRRKFLDNILADGKRLERLVTRLLELARADNVEPSETVIDVRDGLEAITGLYEDRPLDLTIGPGCEGRTRMTMETFETVLTNLIENALQHGATQVRIDARPTPDALELRIEDNGSGISPANRAKIFTPFFTTRREEGGTGLGLDVVRSLLEAHDGQILMADDDVETTFLVRLKREV
ncbi:MAG: ATP-binding protein [Pseudomonadota bacterium]